MKKLVTLFSGAALVATCVAGTGAQSLMYLRGQNVSPAYEGWEQTPDGTKYFLFGYMNRNYEEELDLPVGPNNTFEPGLDRGQPTHFLISSTNPGRRNREMGSCHRILVAWGPEQRYIHINRVKASPIIVDVKSRSRQ